MKRRGNIEVICGAMFSGKTEELIRRLEHARLAGLPFAVFKPKIDDRYDLTHVVSHDKKRIHAITVDNSADILKSLQAVSVIGIDEGQFFDEGLPDICIRLANQGIRVIVAGLDMDYLGRPFGPVPQLLAIAEHISKLQAVCTQCGAPANFSFRIANDTSRILVGEKESYEPRCRVCYFGLPVEQ